MDIFSVWIIVQKYKQTSKKVTFARLPFSPLAPTFQDFRYVVTKQPHQFLKLRFFPLGLSNLTGISGRIQRLKILILHIQSRQIQLNSRASGFDPLDIVIIGCKLIPGILKNIFFPEFRRRCSYSISEISRILKNPKKMSGNIFLFRE